MRGLFLGVGGKAALLRPLSSLQRSRGIPLGQYQLWGMEGHSFTEGFLPASAPSPLEGPLEWVPPQLLADGSTRCPVRGHHVVLFQKVPWARGRTPRPGCRCFWLGCLAGDVVAGGTAQSPGSLGRVGEGGLSWVRGLEGGSWPLTPGMPQSFASDSSIFCHRRGWEGQAEAGQGQE